MKLSIIIPLYNAAATLNKCLESVAAQDYEDMQIILVDDASTDATGQMCEQWSHKDSRIEVAHQQHGGLSAARNTGISLAKGNYITFVDGDDWLAPRTYSTLMDVLLQHPDYDFLEYPMMERIGSKHTTELRFHDKVYTNMREYWLQGQAYKHCYACNKIYRRDLFDNVRFPVGRVFEDVWTLGALLPICHKVATINYGCYYYWSNPNGLTMQANAHDLQDLLEAHNKMLSWASDSAYYAHVVNIALDAFHASGQVPQLVNLPYWNTTKLFIKRLFGLKCLCQIHQLLHRSHS